MLSDEQIRFFRDSGYMRLPVTADSSDVEQIKSFLAACVKSGDPDVRHDSSRNITYISQIFQKHLLIRNIFTSSLVVESLQYLLGENIELLLNRHNHATLTPSGNRNMRFHRDILQWSRGIITVVLYLEEATVENGCTHVIPGSHLFPFVRKPNNGGTWMDEHEVYSGLGEQSLPVPMGKGGLLAFDGLMFHSPGTNRVKESLRPTIAMAYTSVDELLGSQEIPSRVLISGTRVYKGNIGIDQISGIQGK